MKNSMVAHAWAQQNQSTGKNDRGTFRFRDRSLYSYQTEIARFMEGKIVKTNQRYSVTTQGKHANQIYRAASHIEQYCVDRHMRDLPDTWLEVLSIIFTDMVSGIKKQIETILRARGAINDKIAGIQGASARALLFARKNNLELPSDIDMVLLGSDISSDQLLEYFKDKFGADLKKKIEAEKIARARDKARKEEYARAQAILNASKLSEWRINTMIRSVYADQIALRINGEKIETSRGAEIPLDVARSLWRAMENKIDVVGMMLGNFTVRELTKENLIVGCHIIPLSEIKLIAKQLGLK